MSDTSNKTLKEFVSQNIATYFENLDGQEVNNLHNLVIKEVEKSLIQTVMGHAKGNQVKAARILGITRVTLRKKIDLLNIKYTKSTK
tara:strand:- start:863 stop:1123 length:261 start_codon:yes stop_codon:yes gene_type:complete